MTEIDSTFHIELTVTPNYRPLAQFPSDVLLKPGLQRHWYASGIFTHTAFFGQMSPSDGHFFKSACKEAILGLVSGTGSYMIEPFSSIPPTFIVTLLQRRE